MPGRPWPVVLIGPMAAGKSTLGRRVARALGRPYVDSDRVFTKQYGPIPQFFDEHSEAAFRHLEARVVAEELVPGHVISLGGGAVLHPGTRALLTERTTVVHVTVDEDAVARRILNDKRPLLRGGGIDAWRSIKEARDPLYQELADITVNTSRRPIGLLAHEVTQRLRALEAARGVARVRGGGHAGAIDD